MHKKEVLNNPIDIDLLHQFLTANAVEEELEKLADILKCHRDNQKEVFVRNIVSFSDPHWE